MSDSESSREKLWTREYTRLKGINLNYRDEAAPVVLESDALLQARIPDRSACHILDVGCGKGRIGLHLAKLGYMVTGLDFVDSVLGEYAQLAKDLSLADRIQLIRQDMNSPWRIPNQSVDCAMAITVIDNFTSTAQQHHFVKEIRRVLKPRGLAAIEFYTAGDGYYGELLRQSAASSENIVADPYNQLSFKIYSTQEILRLFGERCTLVFEREYSFESLKYAEVYQRNSCLLILEVAQAANYD